MPGRATAVVGVHSALVRSFCCRSLAPGDERHLFIYDRQTDRAGSCPPAFAGRRGGVGEPVEGATVAVEADGGVPCISSPDGVRRESGRTAQLAGGPGRRGRGGR